MNLVERQSVDKKTSLGGKIFFSLAEYIEAEDPEPLDFSWLNNFAPETQSGIKSMVAERIRERCHLVNGATINPEVSKKEEWPIGKAVSLITVAIENRIIDQDQVNKCIGALFGAKLHNNDQTPSPSILSSERPLVA